MKNKILIIITGSIAAYKILDLIRNLVSSNIEVKCILSKSAKDFVTPLSVASISKNKVYENKFDLNEEAEMDHISLSRWADLILIAPATANIISEIAVGSAKDFINTILLASNKKIFIAPAMNVKMWENDLTQKNVQILKKNNYQFIGPSSGELACGEYGEGRMSSVNEIEFVISNYLKKNQFSKNLTALVTAGPTREYIDPVRYISNESSGKQGYEIAKKLFQSGIKTKLIIGPNHLQMDENLDIVKVTSANEMFQECKRSLPVDIAICAAAVADYGIEKQPHKIKKNENEIEIKLKKNNDILEYISKHNKFRPKLVIGFAAETNNIKEYAERKLLNKHCDWIVANDVSRKDIGFNSLENEVVIIKKNNIYDSIPKADKSEIASVLVSKILNEFLNNDQRSLN